MLKIQKDSQKDFQNDEDIISSIRLRKYEYLDIYMLCRYNPKFSHVNNSKKIAKSSLSQSVINITRKDNDLNSSSSKLQTVSYAQIKHPLPQILQENRVLCNLMRLLRVMGLPQMQHIQKQKNYSHDSVHFILSFQLCQLKIYSYPINIGLR